MDEEISEHCLTEEFLELCITMIHQQYVIQERESASARSSIYSAASRQEGFDATNVVTLKCTVPCHWYRITLHRALQSLKNQHVRITETEINQAGEILENGSIN
jgi:hypothetical protein